MDELADHRSARHCRNAALDAETDRPNSSALAFGRQFQHVSARRVFHANSSIGIFQIPGISRMFEVVEKFRRIHVCTAMYRSLPQPPSSPLFV